VLRVGRRRQNKQTDSSPEELIYSFGVSVAGYLNDRDGSIDWMDLDEEGCTSSTTTGIARWKSPCSFGACTS